LVLPKRERSGLQEVIPGPKNLFGSGKGEVSPFPGPLPPGYLFRLGLLPFCLFPQGGPVMLGWAPGSLGGNPFLVPESLGGKPWNRFLGFPHRKTRGGFLSNPKNFPGEAQVPGATPFNLGLPQKFGWNCRPSSTPFLGLEIGGKTPLVWGGNHVCRGWGLLNPGFKF